jgi:hypothetical protein
VNINDAKISLLDALWVLGTVAASAVWWPLGLAFAAVYLLVLAYIIDRRSPPPSEGPSEGSK